MQNVVCNLLKLQAVLYNCYNQNKEKKITNNMYTLKLLKNV